MGTLTLLKFRMTLAAFMSGVLLAASIESHSLPMSVVYMAVGSTLTGLLAGALAQWELYVRGHNDSKPLAVIGTLFSGFAGFFSYALAREYIQDPLKLVLFAICAGVIGRPFVTEVAQRWTRGAAKKGIPED